MESAAVAEAADLLVTNRLKRAAFLGFPAQCAPRTEADGYTIQRALRDRLTGHLGPHAGYKIGCTSKVMQDYMKIDHPCSGNLFASTVHHGEAAVPYAQWRRVGMECEIAMRLSAALGPGTAPQTRDSVAGAVDSCIAAIEIVDDRYEDFRALDVATLIADDFFGAGCVLGEPCRDWRDLDLAALTGVLEVGGKEAARGTGGAVLGHPLEALALFANEAAGRGETIPEGAIVLTGSIVETRWLQPGERAVCRIEGLGAVSLTIDA